MDENQVTQANVMADDAPPVKMLSQDEVNTIVGRAKAQAEAKGRQQAEAEYQRKMEGVAQQGTMQSNPNIDINAVTQQVSAQLDAHRQAQEQAQQRAQFDREMHHVAGRYLESVDKGAASYQDFHDVTKIFDPEEFPQLVYLMKDLPNMEDVIYELSKNSERLGVLQASADRSPNYVKQQLAKISQSIIANKEAQQESNASSVPEPLDRMQPSRLTESGAPKSIRDRRKLPYLRG